MIQKSRLAELPYLRTLTGQHVFFLGELHAIVEVLSDGPALVLQNVHGSVIQDNAYGRAYRRVPETVLVPIYAESGILNPELDSLELRE